MNIRECGVRTLFRNRRFLRIGGLSIVLSLLASTHRAGGESVGEPPPGMAGMDRAQASACEAGDARACLLAARGYAPKGAYRITLSKEEADAREKGTARYARRACNLKEGEGCELAARFGPYGELEAMLGRGCELGHAASCGSLGMRMYPSARGQAELLRAAAMIEKACVANATGFLAFTTKPGGFCYQLGVLYRDTLKNPTKAERFFKLGCTQGYKHGCPCQSDKDCGPFPDDEAGSYSCGGGRCTIVSPC